MLAMQGTSPSSGSSQKRSGSCGQAGATPFMNWHWPRTRCPTMSKTTFAAAWPDRSRSTPAR